MRYLVNCIKDINVICLCRLKMIFQSTAVKIAFLLSVAITVFLVGTFLDSAEEKTSIPIGVIDSDNSEKSATVVEKMKKLKSLDVETGSYDEMYKQLVDGKIYSIIEINDGFEKSLSDGVRATLLKQYYLKGNSNMTVVSDIALSQVLDEICYYECLNEYMSFDDIERISEDEYREHTEYIYDKYEASLKFDFEIINIDSNKDVSDNLSNGIVYRLVLIGIISILVSFIILFASNSVIADKVYNTADRLRITRMGCISKVLGDLAALFVTGEIYIIFSSIVLFRKMQINNIHDIIIMFIGLTLFNFTMDILFIIITIFIREAVMLQILGAFLVCICGIFGSFEMISLILPEYLKKIANFIPNVYLVRIYTKIVLLGEGTIQVEKLGIIASCIFVVMIMMVKISDKIMRTRIAGAVRNGGNKD